MDIKKIRESEIELFDLWHDEFGMDFDGIPIIFSPIEKIFWMNFNRTVSDWGPFGSGGFEFSSMRYQVYLEREGGQKLADAESIHQSSGYYIIDFVFTFWDGYLKEFSHIAVELDGHEFHEKTKEQAKKDKAKDRFLQANGYLVARFTGSEIWLDPQKCIHGVWQLAFSNKLNQSIRNAKIQSSL